MMMMITIGVYDDDDDTISSVHDKNIQNGDRFL